MTFTIQHWSIDEEQLKRLLRRLDLAETLVRRQIEEQIAALVPKHLDDLAEAQ